MEYKTEMFALISILFVKVEYLKILIALGFRFASTNLNLYKGPFGINDFLITFIKKRGD